MSSLWKRFEQEVGLSSSEQAMASYLRWYQEESAETPESSAATMCEDCHSLLWTSEEGFYVCSNPDCGRFYTEVLYSGPEWRFYGSEDAGGMDPARCGMPVNPLLEESALGCRVLVSGGGRGRGRGSGSSSSSSSSLELCKIRQCTEWQSAPYREKAQYNEFQRIVVAAHNAGISKKIIDDALYYCKRISMYKQHFRGDNKGGLLIGAVFLSCRSNGCPRTAGELAEIFKYHVSVATHGCKMAQNIINELDHEQHKSSACSANSSSSSASSSSTTFQKMTPADFIERYCSKLQFTAEFTQLCMFIAFKIEHQQLLPTNGPSSIAAGIVYFVSSLFSLGVTKHDIKQVSEISQVTINKCGKSLQPLTSSLIPASLLHKHHHTKNY